MSKASVAAGKQAYESATDEFARSLATYRNLLPTLYPGIQMPPGEDEEAYKRIAKDLLEKKKADVNGTLISIDPKDEDNLDKRDTASGSLFKKVLGVDNLNKIGSQEGVSAFAGAIEKAVKNNSSDIGLLKGASIGNFFKGLMQWMMGGFKGGFKGLQENVAIITAQNIRGEVVGNLVKLRGERSDLAGMLTDDAIRKAADGAYYGTLEKAGFASPNAPKKTAFKDIVAVTVDDAKIEEMRWQVRDKILNPEKGDKLETKIANEYKEGIKAYKSSRGILNPKRIGAAWFGPGDADADTAARKTAPVIADTISRTITNPETARLLSKMSKEDYAKYISEAVGRDLLANEGQLGFAFNFRDKKDGSEKTNLETFTDAVKNSVMENYGEMIGVTRVAATSGQSDKTAVAARDAAKGANNAGITPASEAPEVIVANVSNSKAKPAGGRTGNAAGATPTA